MRREGGELRFRRGGDHTDPRGNAWSVAGDRDLLDPAHYPNALERIDGSLGCRRTGDVVVSARLGWEFADAGGVHHAGGGSHGSLRAEDSLVPLITVGHRAAAACRLDHRSPRWSRATCWVPRAAANHRTLGSADDEGRPERGGRQPEGTCPALPHRAPTAA